MNLILPREHFYKRKIALFLKDRVKRSRLPVEIKEVLNYSLLDEACHRWRSLLTCYAGEIVCSPNDATIMIASAVECLHSCSLIIDDLAIFDNAALRRGKPTVPCKFGDRLALHSGLWLLSMCHMLIGEVSDASDTKLPLLQNSGTLQAELQKLIDDLHTGQYFDSLSNAHQRAGFEPEAMERCKSGRIFAFAARSPSLLSPSGVKYGNVLDSFGENVGLCYQIMDDLDDVLGMPSVTGKMANMDLAKRNLVTVYGVDRSKEIAVGSLETALSALHELRTMQLEVDSLELLAKCATRRAYFSPFS